MSTIYTESREQTEAALAVIRWFDYEVSSLHHALVMAAERNETDAKDPEVLAMPPAVAGHLIESGQRWRAIADRALELSEKLGDVEQIDSRPHAL